MSPHPAPNVGAGDDSVHHNATSLQAARAKEAKEARSDHMHTCFADRPPLLSLLAAAGTLWRTWDAQAGDEWRTAWAAQLQLDG